jgi:catechol 2,3-dioxygenase
MADTREALTKSKLIDHIERVDLRVRNIDQSIGFFRDVVGLEVADRSHSHAELRAPGGPVLLRLDSTGVTSPADRRTTGLFHLAIRFPTRAALGDVLARLSAAQLELGAGDHLVSEALYIDDPDNNGIELYHDRREEEWPEPEGDMVVPMVTLPVDLEGVLGEGRGGDAVGQPAAEGTDVGHVHLQVSDVGETTRFYTEELGLDLIARMGGQAGFFSSKGYHHNVGANAWNSRHGSPAPKDRAGLERVVFGVDDRSLVDDLRVRLEEHGRKVEQDGDELVVHDPDDIELRFVART